MSGRISIIDILYMLPSLFIALSFHEWGHALAAYKLGDPTARNLGRLTINPIRHIDPLGLLAIVASGFGWAKPVPVNPRNFSKPRRDDILVSVAGVTINFALAFVFVGVYFLMFHTFAITNAALMQIISYFFIINLNLVFFNLLPIPPLDGYHVFHSLTVRSISPNFFIMLERYGFLVLIALLLFTDVITNILGFFVGNVTNGFFAFWRFAFGI